MELQYIGKNIERTDAVKKVTGTARYANDLSMQGILHGAIVRSNRAHARILSIDVSAAKAVAGVVAVLTGADIGDPVPIFGAVSPDQPLLADQVVRFHGEPVAAVLAINEKTAKYAAKLVNVEYQTLPHVTTVRDALKADAPILHLGSQQKPSCSSNIHSTYKYNWGNVLEAKEACTHIITNTYCFPMIHHSPIEPFCVLSFPQENGVVVQSPVQHPFILRRVIAAALKLKLAQVRIIPTEIGGGFGGKGYAKYEPLAAFLALRFRRPIKFSFSMSDGFFTTRRLSAEVNIQTGFDPKGKIVFQDVEANYLIGAYADAGPRVVAKAGYLGLCGPYKTPHARISAHAIYSNTVPATAARGFGMPQVVWAIESQMNEAARLFGMDALQIRLKNIPDKGAVLVPGDLPVDGEWKQGIQLAADMLGWNDAKKAGVGRGISIGIKNPIPNSVSNAIVKLHADNSVTVTVGTTEMGQGAKTVFAQIVAETLMLPVEHISVVMGDTAAAGFDLCTAASRSTVNMGNAIVLACKDVLDQLRNMAKELDIFNDAGEGKISGGLIQGCRDVISYPDLMQKFLGFNQGEVIGKGTYTGKKDPNNPIGGLSDFWEMIFTAVEVEVNADTGKVKVTKMVNVSDLGKVINPLQAKAQEEGGSIMALGHTLMEQMIYDGEGRLCNGGSLDYRIPTAMDVPWDMKSAFLENEDGPGPFGAKGLGESGAISPAPAIADAVRDAVGVVIRDLPLTSEKVWRAIQEQKSNIPCVP